MAFPAGSSTRMTGLPTTPVPPPFRRVPLEILESLGLADEFVQAGNVCHAKATYTSDHKLIKYLTFDELDSAFPSSCNCRRARRSACWPHIWRVSERRWNDVWSSLRFEQAEDGVRATLRSSRWRTGNRRRRLSRRLRRRA